MVDKCPHSAYNISCRHASVGKRSAISGCSAVLVARLNGVQEAAGSTPVTRTNMNSRHSVAAVFSFRRKGTGGKFKFATDLPDIVLTCALQQNRQTKAHKFANFHYLSGKQNVVEYLTKRAIARSFPTMPVLRAAPRPSIR